MLSSWFQGFHTLARNAEHRRLSRQLAATATEHFSVQRKRAVLLLWHSYVPHLRKVRTQMAAILLRLNKADLHRAFAGWRHTASSRVDRRQKVGRDA